MFKEVLLKQRKGNNPAPVVHKMAPEQIKGSMTALCGRTSSELDRWTIATAAHEPLKRCERCARRAHMKSVTGKFESMEWTK